MNTPDPIVLHWRSDDGVWFPLRWDRWMQFRGFEGEFVPLDGVQPGDHCFVICILDEDKTLYNIIPHKYRIDSDGSISKFRFDDLSDEDWRLIDKWQVAKDFPDPATSDVLYALRERAWRANLPTLHAARELLNNLPGFPATGEDRPAISFLIAFGIAPVQLIGTSRH